MGRGRVTKLQRGAEGVVIHPVFETVDAIDPPADVLDTHSCAASGPVISVSCSSGGVTSETPLLPATSDDDDEDAWCDALVAA
jgi:hypothetical protein